MLPTPQNYSIFPSVVLSEKETLMTIVANEKAFFFCDGVEYKLLIYGVDNDDSYYTPHSHQKVTVVAQNGILQFSFIFQKEQEYRILLMKAEGEEKKILASLDLYCLNDDLYELTPIKADFHSHSFRSDGLRDPSAEAGYYREQGYDCFALTDHNRFYPGGEIDETYAGVDTEFFRVKGEEIHAPENTVHIVHIGGNESVAALYVHNEEAFEREAAEYLKRVPSNVPEEFAERYAKCMWVCDKIHEVGGIAIFPHPFWRPGNSVHNINSKYARLLLESGLFDAYEVIGGMTKSQNNASVALWNDFRADGHKIPIVGSSDVHKLEKSVHFPHQFTVCFVKERTPEGVVNAIKEGMSVAVEGIGNEYDRFYHVYGSCRMVFYTQFLLKTYFHRMQQIAHGEGIAMREFAIGRADKSLVKVFAKQARTYRAQFFGKESIITPSKEELEWEEKWRDVQRSGPLTKGSKVSAPPITMQI